MSRRGTNDMMIGMSIIVTAIVLVAGTTWLSQTDVRGKRTRIEARFGDVGNAQVGNAVVIRGVRAGRLESIELADDGWVRVRIGLESDVELPPEPVVLLGASSLFGDWQATILERRAVPDSRDVREQLHRASGHRELLPGAVLPDVAHLTTVADGIADNVSTFAERIRVAFDDEAARELRSSFHNMAVLSEELARTTRTQSKNLDVITTDVRAGAAELTETTRALRRTVARLDSSTSGGEVERMVTDVEHAARMLDSAAINLHALTKRLGYTHTTLDTLLGRSASVMTKLDGRQGSLGRMLNDTTMHTHADSLLREMRALVADVRANPRRYIQLSIF
jgi:phospholipid/cholesterol/gamma-HCH transport system substrate-binding protein